MWAGGAAARQPHRRTAHAARAARRLLRRLAHAPHRTKREPARPPLWTPPTQLSHPTPSSLPPSPLPSPAASPRRCRPHRCRPHTATPPQVRALRRRQPALVRARPPARPPAAARGCRRNCPDCSAFAATPLPFPLARILVPPLSFVAYQLASIGTLARVEPVLHAVNTRHRAHRRDCSTSFHSTSGEQVLNAIKRIIVIGLGALRTFDRFECGRWSYPWPEA